MMNIFQPYVIDNELYVNASEWQQIKTDYTQEHIIQEISDAIVEFEIKLPYREISIEDVNKDYQALKEIRLGDL